MANFIESYTNRYGETYTADSDNVSALIDEFRSAGSASQPSNTLTYETALIGPLEFTFLSAQPSGYDSFGSPNSGRINSGDTGWGGVWGVTVADNSIAANSTHVLFYDNASNWVVATIEMVDDGSLADTWQFTSIVDSDGDLTAVDNVVWHYTTATSLSGLSNYTQGSLSTQLTLSNNILDVNGNDIVWDGLIDGSPGNLVIWGRTIDLTSSGGFYVRTNGQAASDHNSANNSVSGCHIWLINCKVLVAGVVQRGGAGNVVRFGTVNDDRSSDGGRGDTITGVLANKNSETSFNVVNTTFSLQGDPSQFGAMVWGDAKDVTINYEYPESPAFNTTPQNGSKWETIVYDASSASGSGKGGAYQAFSVPDQFDGIQIINLTGYTGVDPNSGPIEISSNGFQATNLLPSSDPDNTNDVDVYRIFQNDSTDGTTTNFTSPRTQFNSNGKIAWRNFTSSGAINRNCAALRKSYKRKYQDEDGNDRDGVLFHANSNVDIVPASDTANNSIGVTKFPDDASSLPSKSARTYISNSSGNLEGTFSFSTGASSNNDEEWGTDDKAIEIPLEWIRCGTVDTSGSFNNVYTNSSYNFETDITEMSLWGTMFEESTINGDDVLDNADADGYFITPSEDLAVVDPTDDIMVEYDNTESNITGKLTAASGNISFNDLAANWKYAVWKNDLTFGNWSSSVMTGTVFDVTALNRQHIELDPAQADTSPVENGTNNVDVSFTCPADSNGLINIVTGSTSHIQTLTADELKVATPANNEIAIQGGNLYVDNLRNIRSFDSTPSDFNDSYSLSNIKVNDSDNDSDDSCLVDLVGGKTYVFNNITAGSRITLTRTSGTEVATVLLTGTTDPTEVVKADGQDSNIEILKIVEITVSRPDSENASADDVGAAYHRAGTEGSLSDTGNPTTTDAPSVDGGDYTFRYEIGTGDNVYAAIAIDGFEIEWFENSGNATRTLTAIESGRLNFKEPDFNTWGTTVVSSDTNPVVVTRPAGSSNTEAADKIVCFIGVSGVSIRPTDATAAKTRTFLRKSVQEVREFMDGILLGYIPTNIFTWDLNNLSIPEAHNNRFELNRTEDTTNSWRVSLVCLDSTGVDLFDSQTKVGNTGEQVFFTPFAQGASLTQVQNALADTRDEIVGHTALPDDNTGRNVKEAYNQAKGAKNAAFAAG